MSEHKRQSEVSQSETQMETLPVPDDGNDEQVIAEAVNGKRAPRPLTCTDESVWQEASGLLQSVQPVADKIGDPALSKLLEKAIQSAEFGVRRCRARKRIKTVTVESAEKREKREKSKLAKVGNDVRILQERYGLTSEQVIRAIMLLQAGGKDVNIESVVAQIKEQNGNG